MNENNTMKRSNKCGKTVPQRFTQTSKMILITLAVSLICGIIFPMIIVDYYAGLNYSLCALCLIAALVYTLVDSKDYKLPQLIYWTIIAIIYTSTFLRVRNEVYLAFSFLLTPVIFTLMIYFTRKQKSAFMFPQLAETFFSPLVHGFKIIPAVSKIRTNNKKVQSIYRNTSRYIDILRIINYYYSSDVRC